MAETKRVDAKVEAPAKELTQAGLSLNPTVHILMANRDALALQDRNAQAAIEAHQAEIEARKQSLADINAQLAELGVK